MLLNYAVWGRGLKARVRVSCLSVRIQAHVPRAESECVRSGPERHVLVPAGLLGGGLAPLEVCERGVGGGRQTRAAHLQLCVHAPRLPKLRSALDESSSVLQQSQTHQQTQRGRTG